MFFFKVLLTILGPLYFHINFRIRVSIYFLERVLGFEFRTESL
jgi:hypothetical protein